MSRNIRLYLEDIKSSGQQILGYTQEMTFEAFLTDTFLLELRLYPDIL